MSKSVPQSSGSASASAPPTVTTPISFASDNHAGTHPRVLDALIAANGPHTRDVGAYGADPYTAHLEAQIRDTFGPAATVYPVFNGSAANVLILAALARSYESVLCAERSHIQVDECGGAEKIGGLKLIGIPTVNGKLTVADVRSRIVRRGDQHAVQPRVLSISNTTECGTLYSVSELRELGALAKSEGLYFHVDGARIANAAAALGVSLRAITTDVGVDAISFGGTKNGAMGAEAVVFLKKELADEFRYVRKQNLQLASKMRFLSAQLSALLDGELWRSNALHANAMAARLEKGLASLPGVRFTQARTANALFAILPPAMTRGLQAEFPFYVWDDLTGEVRLMCSFQTTEANVDAFLRLARLLAG